MTVGLDPLAGRFGTRRAAKPVEAEAFDPRGTGGSNPAPSSAESANHRFLSSRQGDHVRRHLPAIAGPPRSHDQWNHREDRLGPMAVPFAAGPMVRIRIGARSGFELVASNPGAFVIAGGQSLMPLGRAASG
jgi:hypothetical protein